MMQSTSIIVSLLFASSAPAHPLNTTTLFPTNSITNVTLPAGATNHGDPGLICTPATWFTVASFIIANYLAHAATTQLFPGEKLYEQVLAFSTSLFFPTSGVFRGLNNIARGIMVVASYRESELRQATAAGALCMVIRTQEWSPASLPRSRVHGVTLPGDFEPLTVHNWTVAEPHWQQPSLFIAGWPFIDEELDDALESKRQIHGAMQKLPSGYKYTLVPPTAVVTGIFPTPTTSSTSTHLAQSRDFVKVLVALFQLAYSSWTLYEARGDQIERFGYVAFSLTVAPYAVMSVINLMGGLLAPVYPAVFLIHSDVMDEIEHRYGRFFDGTVGTLQQVENLDSCILTREPLAAENPELALVLAAESTPSAEDPQIIIPACAPFQCRDILPHLPYQRRFPPNHIQSVTSTLLVLAAIVVGVLAPILIIYQLSRFHHGRSSKVQRVWVTTWLAFGWYIGLMFGSIKLNFMEQRTAIELVVMRVVYSVPAIGGMVVVGQMIKEYGDCKRL